MEHPLLILDLDETLIFASEKCLNRDEDFLCSNYLVYKRPHLNYFMDTVFAHYRVAVWTSSTESYAEGICSNVFGSRELEFLWARDRCTRCFDPELQEHYWVKNLKKIKRKGYALERALIVDDSPEKLGKNYGSLVKVQPFLGADDDMELLYLSAFLSEIARESNLRKIEKRGWRDRAKLPP